MSSDSLRILVVEDNDTFRETVRELLQDAGYKVRGASSVRKATKRLAHHEFDLVLTDFDLGDASGFDVIEIANAHHPGVKLVMMSATDGLADQALNLGVVRFLAKPFGAQMLLDTVAELLDTVNEDAPLSFLPP